MQNANTNPQSGYIVHSDGMYRLRWESGILEEVPADGPITAASDSHAIASLFGAFDTVEHDRETIIVSRITIVVHDVREAK